MELELERILKRTKEIVANSRTGAAHNQDENELRGLNVEILAGLIITVKDLDAQSKKLEQENIGLGRSMRKLSWFIFVLTLIQVFFVIVQIYFAIPKITYCRSATGDPFVRCDTSFNIGFGRMWTINWNKKGY